MMVSELRELRERYEKAAWEARQASFRIEQIKSQAINAAPSLNTKKGRLRVYIDARNACAEAEDRAFRAEENEVGVLLESALASAEDCARIERMDPDIWPTFRLLYDSDQWAALLVGVLG